MGAKRSGGGVAVVGCGAQKIPAGIALWIDVEESKSIELLLSAP